MKILVVGPGRAGGSLALAAAGAGHLVVGLRARSPLKWELPFPVIEAGWPQADLVVIATRDADISSAATEVGEHHEASAAVHLSGATSVRALASLADKGWAIGSFHPLQTLPDPINGASALAGSFVGITASGELRHRLKALADDVGMTAFDLEDEAKPAYHAGASAASNFLLPALDLAQRLFAAAGVPFAAAAPLSAEVIENAYEIGPLNALTGPVARGDWETVRTQLRAAAELGLGQLYLALVKATAATAGTELPTDLR